MLGLPQAVLHRAAEADVALRAPIRLDIEGRGEGGHGKEGLSETMEKIRKPSGHQPWKAGKSTRHGGFLYRKITEPNSVSSVAVFDYQRVDGPFERVECERCEHFAII